MNEEYRKGYRDGYRDAMKDRGVIVFPYPKPSEPYQPIKWESPICVSKSFKEGVVV